MVVFCMSENGESRRNRGWVPTPQEQRDLDNGTYFFKKTLGQNILLLECELEFLHDEIAGTRNPTQLEQLEASLALQRQEITRFGATDRKDWLLAEVEYLLRLVNQRLIMAGDVVAAAALLQRAPTGAGRRRGAALGSPQGGQQQENQGGAERGDPAGSRRLVLGRGQRQQPAAPPPSDHHPHPCRWPALPRPRRLATVDPSALHNHQPPPPVRHSRPALSA